MEELRYRNIKVPRQLDLSLRRRIEGSIVSAYKACRSAVVFIFSIPGYLNTARKMSLAEWRQATSSTWATVKHEAKHYWVRALNPRFAAIHCTPCSLASISQIEDALDSTAVGHTAAGHPRTTAV